MSTRSRIGIVHKDGSVETIYCHQDGNPSFNGNILLNNYKTEESVLDLLRQGEMSQLGKNICECVFYHRDKGEDKIPNKNYDTIEEAVINFDQEYLYLFVKGVWKYASRYDKHLFYLTPEICYTD